MGWPICIVKYNSLFYLATITVTKLCLDFWKIKSSINWCISVNGFGQFHPTVSGWMFWLPDPSNLICTCFHGLYFTIFLSRGFPRVLFLGAVLSHFGCVWLFVTLWTIAHQNPLPILQARILEWVVISFSRGSSRPRSRTRISYISCINRCVLYH